MASNVKVGVPSSAAPTVSDSTAYVLVEIPREPSAPWPLMKGDVVITTTPSLVTFTKL